MQHLKRNLLSVALASATLMLAANAMAQEATAQQEQPSTQQDQEASPDQSQAQARELETITVTGIRLGIEDAIDTKKNATSIVESISAEDIGKLPDISIAESISRLPGLAAQRVGGRAQVISVRGLSPDFSTTLLNGREMVSTGDNRSVEFDQYPSELMSGVTVYKTPDAALTGQGLSGTLDMRTVRPLDFDKPVYAVGVRYQENSLGSAANMDGDGNRINASLINQFWGGQLGVALGFSHADIPLQEEQTGLYEPWQATEAGGNSRPGLPDGVRFTDGAKALRRTGYIRRNAAMATIELRPYDDFTSTLDVFHTSAMQEDTANQFEVNFGYNGNFPCCTWTPNINGNNTVTGGTLTNVYPLVRGMYNKREDTISAVGWNNVFRIGEATLDTDLSWSKSNRDERSLENNSQLLPYQVLDNIFLNLSDEGFATMDPGLDYSNPAALFLGGIYGGAGYGKTPEVVDELAAFRVNLNIPTDDMLGGFFSDFDLGAHYGDREKQKEVAEGGISGPSVAVDPDLQYGLVDLSFAGVGWVPAWNVPGMVDRYLTFNPSSSGAAFLVAKNWTVNEDITTAWLRGNFDTTWGSVGVKGNIGIQMQHTNQSSDSFKWVAGTGEVPIQEGKSYTDWLPSANIAFSFANDQTLRFALARQLARARLDQLRAGLDFAIDNTGQPGASGGNPELDPWIANAFDVSYEKYFGGNKGYVSAAYFYKDLRSYIYTEQRDRDFSQEISELPTPLPPPGFVADNIGTFTAPYNNQGGMLQGLELTASLPLDLFWDSMEGFGVIASASFFDSDIEILADPESRSSVGSDSISLPGLSDEVYNFTAYYARGGFEARVNQRWRTDFIGEISNFAAERTLRYVEGENTTDAQVSYSFGEESAMKGVTLLLQASNLTNSGYRTYATTKDRPLETIEWGKTYLLGVSYKF